MLFFKGGKSAQAQILRNLITSSGKIPPTSESGYFQMICVMTERTP